VLRQPPLLRLVRLFVGTGDSSLCNAKRVMLLVQLTLDWIWLSASRMALVLVLVLS
jgi:hypothetical protein